VTDRNGNVILEKPYRGKTVISEETAVIMTEMLKNVVSEGTAKEITLKKNIECAGKTGTTQNNYDRWFIGYTPYLLGGVWYGHEYPKELSSASANICEEIWDDIMTAVHKRYFSEEAREFARSDSVVRAEYCRDSGKLATEVCRTDLRGDRTETGYFAVDDIPSEKCDLHVSVAYDTVEGAVASPDCPPSQIKYVGMLKVERSFPTQVFISDAEYVWRDIGDALPETSPALPFFEGTFAPGEYRGISYGETQSNCYCRAHFDYFKWLEKKDGNR
jgi:penicillin-binding protein 1A